VAQEDDSDTRGHSVIDHTPDATNPETRKPTAEQLLRDRQDALMLAADRERIAKEVTSGAIHTLFGIGLQLQAALESVDDDRVRAILEQAITHLDQAIAEVRDGIYSHLGRDR
jgi:signal transduction histidine kinase